MKKLLYFFGSVVLAAMIASCGKTENANGVDSDSIRTADSLAEILRRDSMEWVGFTSKDLTFFGLHGHARVMLTGGCTYEFDSVGNWTRIDDVSPYNRKIDFYDNYSVFSHDKNGYITSEEFWEGGGEFVWSDGRIVGENSFNCAYECRLSYEYDSLGNIGAVTMVESDDAGESWSKPSRIEYSYKAFDPVGNWTMRKSNNGTEERFIIYYDNPRSLEAAKSQSGKNKGLEDFSPWDRDYIFVGSIGAEKKRPLGISKRGGIYTVSLGTRHTQILDYDKSSGQLTVGALRVSDEKKLGEFRGKISREGNGTFRYKGTFTNTNGGNVAFNLVSD